MTMNLKSQQVGVQIPRRFYSEVPQKDLGFRTASASGRCILEIGGAEESKIEEGHLLLDHVHMLISIPPKYAVSQVIGFIKGKSAIHLARVYGEKKRNFVGQHFWARGYFVSTVGRDRGNTRVQQEAGRGGQAPGADESVALISHLQVAHTIRGRVRGPTCALGGS